MKKLLLFLILIPGIALAQKPAKAPAAKPSAAKTQGPVTLTCKIIGQPLNTDSMTLYEYAGLAMRPVQRAGRRPDSSFVFSIPHSKPHFYGVGFSENGAARVIIGEEPEVTLWANATYLDKARTLNSPANRAYEIMRKRVDAFKLEGETHRIAYQQAITDNNKQLQASVQTRFQQLEKSKTQYLDSLKKANPMLWRSASLMMTPNREAEKDPSAYTSQEMFLTKEYFRYANLTDRGYDDCPDVFTAFEAFAKIANDNGGDNIKQLADAQLAKIPAGSLCYRMALGGLVSGFKTAQSQFYPAYTQQYINAYKDQSYGEVNRIEYELKRAGAFTPGMPAPDLIGMTPDSQMIQLSNFRGNYLLVDFWASWCGPCRRENPNVKAMYEKYHPKGFNIVGVSLDRERGAWVKAIEADGLIWSHMSDLKGWNSEHARIYSVSSIPQTVLLDKEGRIVARNLRGEALQEKLRSIYGD